MLGNIRIPNQDEHFVSTIRSEIERFAADFMVEAYKDFCVDDSLRSKVMFRTIAISHLLSCAIFGSEFTITCPDEEKEKIVNRLNRFLSPFKNVVPQKGMEGCLKDEPDIFVDIASKKRGDRLKIDERFFNDDSGSTDEELKRLINEKYVFKKASNKPEFSSAVSIYEQDGETFLSQIKYGLKGICPVHIDKKLIAFATLDGDGDFALRFRNGMSYFCRDTLEQLDIERDKKTSEKDVTPPEKDFNLNVGESIDSPKEINLEKFNEYSEREIDRFLDMIARNADSIVKMWNEDAPDWNQKNDALEIMEAILTHYLPMKEIHCQFGSRFIEKKHGQRLTSLDFYNSQIASKVIKGQKVPIQLICPFDKSYGDIVWRAGIFYLFTMLENSILNKYGSNEFDGILKIEEFNSYYNIRRICAKMGDLWWECSCNYQFSDRQNEWDRYKEELTRVTSAILDKYTQLYRAAYIGDDDEKQKEYRQYEILSFDEFLSGFKKRHKQKPDYARRLTPDIKGYRTYIMDFFPTIAAEAEKYISESEE